MDALLIIDMQEALRQGASKNDLPAVIERINRLAAGVRAVAWFLSSTKGLQAMPSLLPVGGKVGVTRACSRAAIREAAGGPR